MSGSDAYARPGVAGSGTIACSLAACASQAGEVRLLARSDASAWRAEESAQAEARKLDDGVPERIKVTTDPADLDDVDVAVEAIAEDQEAKGRLLAELVVSCPRACARESAGAPTDGAGRSARRPLRSPTSRASSSTGCSSRSCSRPFG